MFRRLPRDNFPDDTESAAFQNYQAGKQGRSWHLPFNWRNWALYGGLGVVVILLSLGIFAIYEQVATSNGASNAPVSTLPPTEIPIVIQGDFPSQVTQIFINIPARIDDILPQATSRGYTFHADEGVEWTFTIEAEGWTPKIDFYGQGGLLLSSSTASAGQEASLTYFIAQEDVYAIHLQSADGLSGSYTLKIMISELVQ